ncbi:hypothetical protein [Schumannella soli]|uniref:Uncharacterized protein n=1 Tax=Schumannella soli TaxID=2590779 RepID=A0A506XZI6_9MICO|nr:hypothetical protein [Schumannella soli]TPW75033.1 hypothetical protein FJ657_12495 [Schumannella soli]
MLVAAGLVVLGVPVAALVGGGALALLIAAAGGDAGALSPVVVFAQPMTVGIAALIATCFLIPGEQLRRGEIVANPDADGAVNVSRFRPLSSGWHLFWALLSLALIVGMLVAAVPATLLDQDALDVPSSADPRPSWLLVSLLFLPLPFVALASLAKKTHWMRVGAIADHPRRAAWRWVTYRWRLDLWTVALGVAVAQWGAFLGWGLSDEDAEAGIAVGTVTVVLGLGLLVLGFWLGRGAPKSGELPTTGESL